MSRSSLTRLGRLVANRRLTRPTTITSGVRPASTLHPVLRRLPHPQLSQKPAAATPIFFCSSFSTSRRLGSPLAPDVLSRVKPAELTDTQYHELSDQYLDNLLNKFEAVQDEREDIDIEYSAGVMNINLAGIGTYVINKQPPNKQIWLSSPVSGPKRFDYVIVSDGQEQKEGTATGGWVYLRDGATLNELLLEETGIDPEPEEPPLDSVVA